MSVENRRFAAAQRTAAGRATGAGPGRRGRWLRLASWLLIVPALSLFSFSVVAGAQTLGTPSLAEAAAHDKQAKQDKQDKQDTKQAVLVPHDDGLAARFSNAKELCWATPSQLRALAARYDVGRISLTVNGAKLDIATVSGKGANADDVRSYLGGSKVHCTLVRAGGVFFLPFDAHGS